MPSGTSFSQGTPFASRDSRTSVMASPTQAWRSTASGCIPSVTPAWL